MLLKRVLLLLFAAAVFAFGQSNDDCMECHSDPDLTRMINDTTEVSVFVHAENFENSIHGGFECIDCHQGIEELPHEEILTPVNCATCHEDAQEEYNRSIHGQALAKGSEAAAKCTDCHGVHDILSSDETESKVHHGNLAYTCASCHAKPEVIRLFGRRNVNPVASYLESVHGKMITEDPEAEVATCTDCHDYHAILPAINPESHLNALNIPETCGTCHESEKDEYHDSIHWNSLQRGHGESPVCTDCHGEHDIKMASDKNATTSGLLQSTKLCASCHSSPTLMSRFGLDAERLDSYMKSYHGLAALKGSPEVATCTSCHETHAIKSKSDSLASVHPAHLQETCGKCHANISDSFVKIDVHPINQQVRNPIAFFFKNLYIWMIVVVIGGMFIHNLIILVHHIREKRKADKYAERVPRFQSFEVYQHMLMFLSFTLLAITGFALKFPEAGWVKLLVSLGMTEIIRSVTHRVAAVVMGTISVVQLGYLLFTQKGRRELIELMPTLDDVIGLWKNISFYLGLSKERPRFGRFDYAEKAEYLALIWGVIVMGASGLVLWFPEIFIGFLPTWLFETSEVIHYYEAWLATLAIVIWHWFFVILHPEKYPMSTTWMDGKITLDEMKHHHPLEYEKLMEQKDNSHQPKI